MAGETKAVGVSYLKPRRQLADSALCCQVFSIVLATTEMESADVVNLGYLPAGVKVVAVGFAPTDIDGVSNAVSKITIGSTDVLTGLTNGRLGAVATQAASLQAIIPYDTTSKTLVSTTFTTVAATPAAGTIHVSFWYFTNYF